MEAQTTVTRFSSSSMLTFKSTNELDSLHTPTKRQNARKTTRGLGWHKHTKDTRYPCFGCDGVDVVGGVCVAGVQRSAVKQREDHSSFSKSGIGFILFKQTKCQHRQFFLTSFSLTHPHFVTRAAGNTFIARSEITSLDNKIGDMCFLARFEHGFLNNHRIIKAQMASNENLKTDLFNHIHRMYKYDGAV